MASSSEAAPIPAHRPCLGQAESLAVAAVFESRWLGSGATTRAFEDALREQLCTRHVLAVSSGTAALHLALDALELPPGSQVLVPSLTFVATIQAVVAAGLRPVFCEVDAATLSIDVADARRRVTPEARAILPVHFGGASCDMPGLTALAREHGLRVVEDAAHAFGSRDGTRMVGTCGDAGCFSFDPIKNITCGEGGAVATDSDLLARRIGARRNLGMASDAWSREAHAGAGAYEVRTHGYRYHLSNVNAAVGLAQLARAPSFRARKQAIVARYDEAFRGLDGLVPLTRPSPHVFPFTYVVRVPDGRRDGLRAHLRACGIGSLVEYVPNHLQPAFARFRAALPATERLYGEIVSLPLYVELADRDQDRVIAEVTRYLGASLPAPERVETRCGTEA